MINKVILEIGRKYSRVMGERRDRMRGVCFREKIRKIFLKIRS